MIIFEPLRRVIKVKDLSVAEFLLPYLVVHVIIGQESSQEDKDKVLNELLNILKQDLPTEATYMQREDMKLFCEVCVLWSIHAFVPLLTSHRRSFACSTMPVDGFKGRRRFRIAIRLTRSKLNGFNRS
jgi:hypothetical protein